MNYYSTRDAERKYPASLREAAFAGLAPDGGLYMPEHIPQVDIGMVHALADKSFADMAAYIAGLLFDEIPSSDINRLVYDAYNFRPELHSFSGTGFHTLELFHGPTLAFKDFGARFMGRMLDQLGFGGLTVLTATSGDTGSAVAHGFHNVPGVQVVILFPDGKVSPLQEAQMTSLGGNIHAVRVIGNFDDCQRMVKEVFSDTGFRSRANVTSANSINILRWMPQCFYYFYGQHLWSRATGREMPEIVVPSGNYGNIAAGMLAWRMGLPVQGFVAASNDNDEVPVYLQGGEYRTAPSIRTVANAMDVGAPSNFERMLNLCDGSDDKLRSLVRGYSLKGEAIKDAIREIHDRFGYLSCPHSAIGYSAAKAVGADGFWLSTAHAAKFGEVIADACGITPEMPEQLVAAMQKPKRSVSMEADSGALENLILRL